DARAPRATDQRVVRVAGYADQHISRITADHVCFEANILGDTAEGEVDRPPQPLPGSVSPDLPQVRRRVTAVGEVAAGRRPREDRYEGHVVQASEICRMAERLEAAR